MATTRRRRLFVSYSGLLRALYSGRVPMRQLEDALFYFSCERSYAFDVGVGGMSGELPGAYARDESGVTKVYNALLAALRAAEADGRVAWRGHEPSWESLNELLDANGYPPLDWRHDPRACFEAELATLAAQDLGHPLCVFNR